MTSKMDDDGGAEAVAARSKTGGRAGGSEAEEQTPKAKKRSGETKTAEEMAAKQREISVSEFFAKNRHLLGFDNPRKALLTTVKEAVDNALDACEEAGIRRDLYVEIQPVTHEEERFRVIVQDNASGIVKEQIGKIFAKLLYGSKFHSLRQSRGQQGIGISAAGMYGQLTTGKPMFITSRIDKKHPAHRIELRIDTARNQPEILKEMDIPDWESEHGTRVEMELVAKYLKGRQSVDEYLALTAVSNPHIEIAYKPPDGDVQVFKRAVKEMPTLPAEIKPHPHGVELGVLMKILKSAEQRKLKAALKENFS